MPRLQADTPLQYLRGVGPRRAEALRSLGLQTCRDLLNYFPFRHELEQGEVAIADLEPGTTATVRGTVVDVGRRGQQLRVELHDDSESCELRWFNLRFPPRGLTQGARLLATGKVELFQGIPNIVQPRVRVFAPDDNMPPVETQPRLVGVYSSNKQVTSPIVRSAVLTLLEQLDELSEEHVPPALLAQHGLVDRRTALLHMHTPPDVDQLETARVRLAYDEFLVMELGMALRRRKLHAEARAHRIPMTAEINERIRARFPFALTEFQDGALREIVRDLGSGQPMTRLLQGDVGSGKTVVALYACLAAIAGGHQAAIMAPTEVLALQHYERIEQYLRGSRVRRALLRGRLPRSEREELLKGSERGDLDLLVGTHALLQQDVGFKSLGLIVVDEQHKFGVMQRSELRTKGLRPHCLVMTATPIPRSLAMTVLGDLDVSTIRGAPPGRGQIRTRIITPGQWEATMRRVAQRLQKGEQAYFVCPAIREAEPEADGGARKSVKLISAEESYERLRSGPWSDLNLALLHGSLSPDEKRDVLERFSRNELHAVVATTVVEVGVDVANATTMIVENADRFGLSQLHQLRGRVGRGNQDSECLLIARSRGTKARERLKVLAEETDGFRIAEADLRLRGPGELLGTRQHGLPELKLGSMVDDFGLLEKARDDAFALVADDPTLRRPEHAALRAVVRRALGGKLTLLDAG